MRRLTSRSWLVLACCGVWVASPVGAWAQLSEFRPASKSTSTVTPALSEPPQQRTEWKPPDTKIPPKLVVAAGLLFENGLADPRGCEYREIEVIARNVWGQEQKIKTHGWVLPAKGDAEQRFAVCWTGLVYPAISVGAAANTAVDMEAIIKSRQGHEVGDTIPPMGNHFHSEHPELAHISETRLELPLLLRLGEGELAEAYWNTLADKDVDRFLDWASVWTWYMYDRAITAHMQGDHGLALAMSQKLADVRPRIEAAAAERGYEKYRSSDGAERPFLYFLSSYRTPADPVQALVADSKRRVAAEKSPPLSDARKITDQAKRVAALVRQLEEVDDRQDGQPGGVSLNLNPVVNAFEREGDAAIEPLLACFESDDRLTRSVSFSRDFGSDRHLIPVFEAAYAALVGVLHTDKFGPATTHGVDAAKRAEAAAELRAFAKRAKGRSLAEQWYDTLADDNAHPGQWRDAALRIVQPADSTIYGYFVELPNVPTGQRPKMHGDELRSKNPYVSALLAKRIPQMTTTKELSSETLFRAGDATQMALALAIWEPEAARPVLRQLIDRCHELERAQAHSGYSTDPLISRSVSLLTSKLVELGEPESLRDYAQWAVRQHPNREIAETLFKPLWEHPDDPDAIAAVRAMFLAEDAPWRSLPRIPAGDYWIRLFDDPVVASPLVSMSVYRDNLLANLTDKARLGVISVDAHGQNYTLDDRGAGGSSISNKADPLLPRRGEERIIRVCDWYAAELSTLPGAPRFEFYWPEDSRDKAIEAIRTYLRERGDALRRPAK